MPGPGSSRHPREVGEWRRRGCPPPARAGPGSPLRRDLRQPAPIAHDAGPESAQALDHGKPVALVERRAEREAALRIGVVEHPIAHVTQPLHRPPPCPQGIDSGRRPVSRAATPPYETKGEGHSLPPERLAGLQHRALVLARLERRHHEHQGRAAVATPGSRGRRRGIGRGRNRRDRGRILHPPGGPVRDQVPAARLPKPPPPRRRRAACRDNHRTPAVSGGWRTRGT